MDKLTAFMSRVALGLPLWAWALLIAVLAVNDLIKAAKWTRAESFIEALAMTLLGIPILGTFVLAKFPVIGWVLRKLAGPVPDPAVLK